MKNWKLVAPLVLALCGSSPVGAAEFYAGKTITLIVGSGAGGGFDAYSRFLARFLGNHIPGNPNVVVQNMPGAGGLTATGYVYTVAPKDGTVILEPNPVNTLEPLLDPSHAKFDPRKFNWIGSLNKEIKACAFWSANINNIDDLKARQVLIGASGPASGMSVDGKALQMLLGFNFKLIPGYSDTVSVELAARRGELDGFCGLPSSRLKTALWAEFQSGAMKVLIQMAVDKSPDLPNVPSAFDLVQAPETRQVLRMLYAPWSYGQPFAAPPGIAPERIDELRAAFEATTHDPAVLAEALKLNLDINPLPGLEIKKLLDEIYQSSPEVVMEARKVYGVQGN